MSVSSVSSSSGESRSSSPEDSLSSPELQNSTDELRQEQEKVAALKAKAEQNRREEKAFTCFLLRERMNIMKSSPHMSMREVSQKLAEKWRSLQPSERAPYVELYSGSAVDGDTAKAPNAKRPCHRNITVTGIPSPRVDPWPKKTVDVVNVDAASRSSVNGIVFPRRPVSGVVLPPPLRPSPHINRGSNISAAAAAPPGTVSSSVFESIRNCNINNNNKSAAAPTSEPSKVTASVAAALGLDTFSSPRPAARIQHRVAGSVMPPPLRSKVTVTRAFQQGQSDSSTPRVQVYTNQGQPYPSASVSPAPAPAPASSAPRPQLGHHQQQQHQQKQSSRQTGGAAAGNTSGSGSGLRSAKEALDMFYLSLCEPAFPHPDEAPLTPYNANYCYDAYLRMNMAQAMAKGLL